MAIQKNLNEKAFLSFPYYGKAETLAELSASTDTDLDGKFFLVGDRPTQLFFRQKLNLVSGLFQAGLVANEVGLFLINAYALVQESQDVQVARTFRRTGNDYVFREAFNCFFDTEATPRLNKIVATLGAHYTEVAYNHALKTTTKTKVVVTSDEALNPSTRTYFRSTMNHLTGEYLEFMNAANILFHDTFTGADGDTLV